MNSEQWEQLWREQGEPPASAVNIDRFHEQIRPEPEEWERDLDDSQRLMIRLTLLNILLTLPGLVRGGFTWSTWPGLLSNLLMVTWLLVQRRQRDRIYRDYGVSMSARLDQIEHGLRVRHGNWTNAAFAVGVILVMSLLGLNMAARLGFEGPVMTAIAVGFGGLMVIPIRAQARLDRSRLEAALDRVARARAQLVGGPRAPRAD